MLSGVVSDRLFKGRRNVPALIFGLTNTLALCLFLLVPGVHFWLDALAMVLFGIGIGVLICFLGGLMAVDIAPRNASGAALGVVGIASYIGAGLQDVMSGVLIEGQKTVVNGTDVYDFTYINWFCNLMFFNFPSPHKRRICPIMVDFIMPHTLWKSLLVIMWY